MPRHPGDSRLGEFLGSFGRSEVPRRPPVDGPPRPPRRLEVFAVGIDWAQLTWSALGPGPVVARAGDTTVEIHADGGPGAAMLHGLPAGTAQTIELRGEGLPGSPVALRATTLAPPPGEELFRIATISDVHVGSRSTGYFHTITEVPAPDRLHPVRCLAAAAGELASWGAEHLVIKGDLIDQSTPENWRDVDQALGGLNIPVDLLPGNHETSKQADTPPHAASAAIGLHLVRGVQSLDRPGIRMILADTTRPGTDLGRISSAADRIVSMAGRAQSPVLVLLHHQMMRFRFPTYLPPGIPGPEAADFLRRLGAANASTLVSSGHTHRHRRRDVGPVTLTEVGSTKDFPGTWAGYQIFDGGIVQTVRRISEPSCIRWTDHTRRAAAGVWALWSPGGLDDRCFTRTW